MYDSTMRQGVRDAATLAIPTRLGQKAGQRFV